MLILKKWLLLPSFVKFIRIACFLIYYWLIFCFQYLLFLLFEIIKELDLLVTFLCCQICLKIVLLFLKSLQIFIDEFRKLFFVVNPIFYFSFKTLQNHMCFPLFSKKQFEEVIADGYQFLILKILTKCQKVVIWETINKDFFIILTKIFSLIFIYFSKDYWFFIFTRIKIRFQFFEPLTVNLHFYVWFMEFILLSFLIFFLMVF
jgi:hypothetical protein